MSNEVTKKSVFGDTVGMVNTEALVSALGESAAKDPRGSAPNGSEYLNFSGKRGLYEFGQEKENLDPEEPWIINIGGFEDGWVCWKGGQPMATRLYPMGTPVPTPDFNEHGPFSGDGDGWSQAKSMVLKSLSSGRQAYFKNNSVSGVSAFANLQKDVVARARAGLAAHPVVKLETEAFSAKGHKNYKPVFNIIGWLDDENVVKLAELFDDENVDLEEALEGLIEASAGPTALEEKKPEKVKRTLRPKL